jgi:hypothetical protein
VLEARSLRRGERRVDELRRALADAALAHVLVHHSLLVLWPERAAMSETRAGASAGELI